MLWEFRNSAPYTGDTLGSVQQADDGSVLVNWGAGLQPIVEELAPNGTRLMAIGLPAGGNSYRTVKYPPSDFDVATLRATAGGSVTPPLTSHDSCHLPLDRQWTRVRTGWSLVSRAVMQWMCRRSPLRLP